MKISHLVEDLEDISMVYASKFGIDRTSDWFIMKLTEELGELMQSYLKYVGQARIDNESDVMLRQNLEDELADVIGMALLMSKSQDINLEEAFKRKWLKYHESPRSIV